MTTLQRFLHWCVLAALVFQPLSQVDQETSKQGNKADTQIDLSTVPLSTTAACFWADLDCDYDVDADDARAAADHWNCATGAACYAANLDRNSDGVIDALDLAYFGNQYDVAPPVIAISSPGEGALIGSTSVQVSGTFSAVHTVTSVVVNGVTATLGPGTFAVTVPISAGNQTLSAIATDEVGKAQAAARLVFVDQTGPFINLAAPLHRQAVYTLRPTITVSYTDFYTNVNTTALHVALIDHNQISHDVTGQLVVGPTGATGQPDFDLAQDTAYTLTASLQDTLGNPASAQSTFFVPAQAASLVPPASTETAGWVSGVIYDSTRCDGYLVNCQGLAGAHVTLARVDAAALAQARLNRAAELSGAVQPQAADQVSVTTPVTGVIVTGPDGFFAFPVAQTARYVVRVEQAGYTYGQRLAEIVQERSTPVNEIYLTPLDPATTYCTAAGCDHLSADGQMEVVIPPGAIGAGQIVTVTATEFDRVNFLPGGELPPGTWETYAFNLGGNSEITFTLPITVRVKNSKGFAPGEIIPLGYWNQALLQWEHVTTSTVDASGQWVDMQVTHFSNYDPNAPVTVNTARLDVENQTGQDEADCSKDPCGSEITLRGGYLRQNIALPPIEVLGQSVAPAFNYDSGRADPSEVIDVKLNLTSAPGIELGQYVQAELFIEGEKTANYSFAAPDLNDGGDLGRFRFLWDGRNAQGARLPPGIYRYAVRVRVPYRAQWYRALNNRFGGPPDYTRPMGRALEATADQWVYGAVTLDADPGGPFGLGWKLAGQQHLYEDESGRILVSDGTGNLTEYYFAAQNQLLPSVQQQHLRPTEVTGLHGLYVPEVAGQVTGEQLLSNGTIHDQLTTINDHLPMTTINDHLPISDVHGHTPDAQPVEADLGYQPEALTSETSGTSDPAALILNPTSLRPDPLAPSGSITQNITADTTWTLAESPYTLTTNINVSAGVTLTIEPGVIVKGNSGVQLSVQGQLIAIGTVAQPITFTSATNTGANQWQGLVFNGGTGDLRYVTVRYGGWATWSNIAVNNVLTGEVRIEHSRILTGSELGTGSDAGVYVNNSRVTINETLFSGNGNTAADFAVNVRGTASVVTLTNSTFQNNLGYALYVSAESLHKVTLSNNTFSGNGLNRALIAGGTTTQTVTLPAQVGLDAYEVMASLTIPAGAVLNVGPGAQMMTRSSQGLYINGHLTADGTAAQPITFTSATNTGGNQWQGLAFNGGTGDLRYVTVRYAGWGNNLGIRSNVTVYNVGTGEVRIENSQILTATETTGADYGVYVSNSRVAISGTVFSGNGFNTSDCALYAANPGAVITLTNAIIQHNNGYAARLYFTDTQTMAGNTFANNAVNRVLLPAATLTADATLSKQTGLDGYELEGSLIVPSTTVLTVAPDLAVLGRSAAQVLVYGHLQAVGTPTQPITFTSATNTAPNQWVGLQFDGGTGDLRHVTVRYGGSNGFAINAANLAARNVLTGQVRIENSRIISGRDNGIYLLNANALISGTTLAYNTGYPINTTPESMHRLAQVNNTFGGNTNNWVFIWPSGTFMGDVTFARGTGLEAYWIGQNTVLATTTLTIDGGLAVIGDTGSGLTVYGTLTALGTPTQPITFTGQDASRYFGAIDVAGAQARGHIAYATILRGYANTRPAIIVARDGASVTLRNTSILTGFIYSTPGILATNNATLTVEGGQVYRAIRSGISIVNSRAEIRGVQLINNGSASDYALDVTGNSRVTIFGNTIAQNPGFPVRVPVSAAHQLGSNTFLNNLTSRARLTGDGAFATDLALNAQNGLTGYEFDGNVTVPAGVTLNVGPGATLMWASGKGMTVQGALHASGSDTRPITFTSLTNSGAGQWTGLTFNTGSGRFDYATVRYATTALRANNSPIELRYSSIISNSQHAITLTGNSTLSAPGAILAGNGPKPTYYGLLNQTGQLIDARYIWWGTDTGPYHAVKNPGGLGNQVSNDVIFQPWAGMPQQALITSQSSSDDTQLIFDPNDGTYTRRYPDGTLVHFNVLGQHDYSTNPIGQQLRYGYDAAGRTVSMSIVLSGEVTARWVWTFAYGTAVATNSPWPVKSAAASTVSVIDPAGRVSLLTVDERGDLITVQEPGLSAPTTFAYDAQHRLTHKRDARGYLTQYTYGTAGRMAQVILPPRPIYDPVTQQFTTRSEVHTFTPSDSSYPLANDLEPGTPLTPTAPLSRSAQLIDAVQYGAVLRRGQTNALGAVISTTDTLSRTASYVRDDRNRLTRLVNPDGSCREYTYDATGHRLSETRLSAGQCALPAAQRDPAQLQRATYTYEPRFNNVKSVTDALSRTIVYTYEYELGVTERNLLVQTQYPPVAAEHGVTVTPVTTIDYNAFGQVTRRTNLRGIATCYTYTLGIPAEAHTLFAPGVTPVPGRLTEITEDCGGPQARTTTFTQFDAVGNAARRAYPGAQISHRAHDVRSRVISETSAVNVTTVYAYDNADNRTQTIQAANTPLAVTTDFVFDAGGLIVSVRTARGGQATELRYGHDLNRRRTLTQDANGHATRYFYDSAGQLTRVIDPLGHTASYTYDVNSRLIAQADPAGVVTTRQYDAFGREWQLVADAGGLNRTTTSAYDAGNRVITQTDALGRLTCQTYDAYDRVTVITADCGGLQATTRLGYDLNGNTVVITDANGHATRYAYDRLDQLTTITDALNATRHITHDVAGNIVAQRDPLGRVSQSVYDQANRLIASRNPLNGQTTYTYDALDNVIATTDPLGATAQFEYDAFSRRVKIINPLGGVSLYGYDANGNAISVIDPLGRTTTYAYDALNRPIGSLDPTGGATRVDYDAAGRVLARSNALQHTTRYAYDALGRQTAITLPNGNATTYAYDLMNNRLAVTTAAQHTTRYGYDGLYRTVALTDPNNAVTRFAYDLAGNRLSVIDPLNNATTYEYDALNRPIRTTDALGATRVVTYDAASNLTAYTDRAARTTTFAHDALNRLTAETWAGTGRTLNFGYDANSRLTTTGDATTQLKFGYDALGRRTQVTTTIGSAPVVALNYQYDAYSNLVSVSELIGGQVRATTAYQYDARNTVSQITQSGSGVQSKRVNFGYSAINQPISFTRYGASAVATTALRFNANGNPVALTHTLPSAVQVLTWAYDALDRVTGYTLPDGASMVGYDARGQVISATHTYLAAEAYAYDANGNRSGGSYSIGLGNRLTSDGTYTYTYDAEGNRAQRIEIATGAITQYAYDYRNRLTGLTFKTGGNVVTKIITYTYDALDQRAAITVDADGAGAQAPVTELLIYDRDHLALTLDTTGSVTHRYLNGPATDLPLADETGGQTQWALTDLRGTVNDVINSSGAVQNHLVYDAFGNIKRQTVTPRLAYTGREWDSAAGLYFYRSRYYDPRTGSFISEDHAGLGGGDVNLYRYVTNNPINLTDPYGYAGRGWLDGFTAVRSCPTIADAALQLYSLAALSSLYGEAAAHDVCGWLAGLVYAQRAAQAQDSTDTSQQAGRAAAQQAASTAAVTQGDPTGAADWADWADDWDDAWDELGDDDWDFPDGDQAQADGNPPPAEPPQLPPPPGNVAGAAQQAAAADEVFPLPPDYPPSAIYDPCDPTSLPEFDESLVQDSEPLPVFQEPDEPGPVQAPTTEASGEMPPYQPLRSEPPPPDAPETPRPPTAKEIVVDMVVDHVQGKVEDAVNDAIINKAEKELAKQIAKDLEKQLGKEVAEKLANKLAKEAMEAALQKVNVAGTLVGGAEAVYKMYGWATGDPQEVAAAMKEELSYQIVDALEEFSVTRSVIQTVGGWVSWLMGD